MRMISLCLIFIFFISFCSGISLNIHEVEIQPYETVIGKIEGNVSQPPSKEDMSFFLGRREVSLESDIKYYNGSTYVWFKFNREGNFSVKIGGFVYSEGGMLKEGNIEQEFVVEYLDKIDNETNESYHEVLEISPGILFEKDELWLKNRGNKTLNVSYFNNSIILEKDDIKKIMLEPVSKFDYVNFSSYRGFSVPIIYPSYQKEVPIIEQNKNSSLKTNIDNVSLKIFGGESEMVYVQLFNLEEEPLVNGVVEHSLDILEINLNQTIPAKEISNMSLYFYSDNQGYFSDNLNISFDSSDGKEYLILPVEIYVFPENASEEEIAELLSCEDRGGKHCQIGEYCTNDESDSFCCFGGCEEIKGGGGNGRGIWGTILGIIIFVFLGFAGLKIWKKFKNSKSNTETNPVKKK